MSSADSLFDDDWLSPRKKRRAKKRSLGAMPDEGRRKLHKVDGKQPRSVKEAILFHKQMLERKRKERKRLNAEARGEVWIDDEDELDADAREMREIRLKQMAQAGEDIVWQPQPGSQDIFIRCPIFEVLLSGTRGGGKTDVLIMDFLQHVGVGWKNEWRGILFRRSYPELDDIIKKTKKWIPLIFPDAVYNKNDHTWTFRDGEQLLLRHMDSIDDYGKYHGHEYAWIAFEELSNWPNLDCYNIMKSCCRSSVSPDRRDKLGRPMPRKYRSTTNPYGPGHNAVKKHFGLPHMFGKIITYEFAPEGQKPIQMQRIALHSTYLENQILMKAEPGYAANIAAAARNPAEAAAWLYGSWDITSGGMFDDLWNGLVHVVEPFAIPSTWYMNRSFDWGSSKPASVGWWAQSDGSDVVLPNGRKMSTVRGDLFRVHEWYIAGPGNNSGLKLTAQEISAGIIAHEMAQKWRSLNMRMKQRIKPGPADASIWDSSGGPSIAAQMEKKVRVDGVLTKGITWEKADKSPGSRKNGWESMRQMLKSAMPPEDGGPREKPGLFIFNTCEKFINLVPIISRDGKDPDDVDTKTEDHIADEARYRVMTPKRTMSSGSAVGAH